jgi:hypothetical protein
MARLLRAAILIACFLYAGRVLAAGGTCPNGIDYPAPITFGGNVTLANLGITNCYFIASNGADSNSGTNESSPWAHLPGMSGCSANCAAHTPAAGEGYILRGGDTWTNSAINWAWSGTSANPLYVGIDTSWYSGSSWTRPKWTSTGTVWSTSTNKSYVIVDNIETSGLVAATGNEPNIFVACGKYMTLERLYLHGWTTTETTNNPGSQAFGLSCGMPNQGTTLRYNVIDGTDSSRNMLFVTHSNTPIAYGNVMTHVYTGLDGCGDDWHDNLLDDAMVQGVVTGHQDGLYQQTQCYSPNSLIYNNVIRNVTNPLTGGAVKLWLNGNGVCPFPSCTNYAFNNVIYNTYPGNTVDTGGHLSGVNYGTWYFFNNTIQCGTNSNIGMCKVGMTTGATLNMYLSNNHWIQSGTSSPLSCTNDPGGSCSQTNDLMQTLSQANAQGYTDTSAYAFQPTSTSSSTVTEATTLQSLCATIGAVDADAGAACQSDTTYACSYDTTNHTVRCPTRETVARTAKPNIGAYQFSSTQAPTLNPPAGLTASVQ